MRWWSRIHLLKFISGYKPFRVDSKKNCGLDERIKHEIATDKTPEDKYYEDGQQKCKELCTSESDCKFYTYTANKNKCALYKSCNDVKESADLKSTYEKIGKSLIFL